MRYTRKEVLENLRLYKYSCTDDSKLSKWVLQPYWNFMIRFVPLWLAPNMVTLIGFLAIIINFLTVLYYLPNLTGEAPRWVYLSLSIGIQWYSLLDNLDGRQARRTANSSPLGELFDHGCDCLALPLIFLSAAASLQLGAGFQSLITLMFGAFLFWLATWEEYHTGSLYLGVINGPTEGLQLVSFLYFLTYMNGGNIWIQPVTIPIIGKTLLWNEVLIYFVIFCSIITAWFNVKSVRTTLQKQGSTKKLSEVLMGLVSFGLIFFPSLLWFFTSQVWEQYPYLITLGITLCFGELTSRLILAHVTKDRFPTIQRPHLPLLAAVANSTIGYLTGSYIVPEPIAIIVLLLVSTVFFGHYVVNVVRELCEFLGIKCLKINHKKV